MLIYKITNKINNKSYIGQTSQLLKDRIRQYREDIKFRPNSRPIIIAMNKYGFNNFSFEIIEDNISNKQELDDKERYYIKYFESLVSQKGYNIELGGNGPGKHSEETKRKIGESQKGSLNHMYGKKGFDNLSSKPVIEITTGKKYGSASVAAEQLGVNFSHVCAVARGDRGSTGGFVFRYLDDNHEPIRPENPSYIKFVKVRNNILDKYKYLI